MKFNNKKLKKKIFHASKQSARKQTHRKLPAVSSGACWSPQNFSP